MCELFLLPRYFAYSKSQSHGGESSDGPIRSQTDGISTSTFKIVPIGYVAIMMAMVASMGGVSVFVLG